MEPSPIEVVHLGVEYGQPGHQTRDAADGADVLEAVHLCLGGLSGAPTLPHALYAGLDGNGAHGLRLPALVGRHRCGTLRRALAQWAPPFDGRLPHASVTLTG